MPSTAKRYAINIYRMYFTVKRKVFQCKNMNFFEIYCYSMGHLGLEMQFRLCKLLKIIFFVIFLLQFLKVVI